MEDFCTDYEEIKERLKEKGIHLTRESLHPADEKYVKNIDLSQKNTVSRANQTRKESRKRNKSKRMERRM